VTRMRTYNTKCAAPVLRIWHYEYACAYLLNGVLKLHVLVHLLDVHNVLSGTKSIVSLT